MVRATIRPRNLESTTRTGYDPAESGGFSALEKTHRWRPVQGGLDAPIALDARAHSGCCRGLSGGAYPGAGAPRRAGAAPVGSVALPARLDGRHGARAASEAGVGGPGTRDQSGSGEAGKAIALFRRPRRDDGLLR